MTSEGRGKWLKIIPSPIQLTLILSQLVFVSLRSNAGTCLARFLFTDRHSVSFYFPFYRIRLWSAPPKTSNRMRTTTHSKETHTPKAG